jgi:hypothetical protein
MQQSYKMQYYYMETFGEHVAARKFPHMLKEIFLKAALYMFECARKRRKDCQRRGLVIE